MIETGSRIYLPPVTDLKAIAAGIFEEDDTGVQVFIGMPFNMLGISLDSDCIPPIHTMETVRQNPTRQSLPTPVSSVRGQVRPIRGCFKIHPALCLLHLRLYLLFQSMYQWRFILHTHALSFLAASSQFPLILDNVSFWQAPCSICQVIQSHLQESSC